MAKLITAEQSATGYRYLACWWGVDPAFANFLVEVARDLISDDCGYTLSAGTARGNCVNIYYPETWTTRQHKAAETKLNAVVNCYCRAEARTQHRVGSFQ